MNTCKFLQGVRFGLLLAVFAALAFLVMYVFGFFFVKESFTEANLWLFSIAFLLEGPTQAAWCNTSRVANSKLRYMSGALFSTVCSVFLSHALVESNPLLVWTSLSLFWLLLVYCKERVFHIVRLRSPPAQPVDETRLTLACLVAIAGTGALLMYAPAWMAAVLYGGTTLGFKLVLWYMPRHEMQLSNDQHADVWPRYFRRPEMVARAWSCLTEYVCAHDDVPEEALRKTLQQSNDVDALLVYFPFSWRSPKIFPGMHTLTRLVEERLCALDSDAHMVFSMHTNDKNTAADTVKRMRRGQQEPVDTLDIPELSVQAH